MKKIIAGVSAAGATLVAVAGGRRVRAIRAIVPELRSPVLAVLPSIAHDWQVRLSRRFPSATPAVAEGVTYTVQHTSSGVPVHVFDGTQRSRPSGALLWIHGGGLVLGTPTQSGALLSRIAAELGVLVASVEYRLAPEHPFPAGLDDCMSALQWLHEQSSALGLDPARVAIGGDSAGGCLAAALAQRAHDEGGPRICFQLLQYPMLDERTALRKDHDALLWSNRSNRYAWQAYLGHPVEHDEVRPYAVPARRVDLAGLPPAWVGIGSIDLFRDEAHDYAVRLQAAGVPCEYVEVPGMYHAAEAIRPGAPSMQAFVQQIVDAARRALVPGADPRWQE